MFTPVLGLNFGRELGLNKVLATVALRSKEEELLEEKMFCSLLLKLAANVFLN